MTITAQYKYTEAEIKQLLKSLTIITDTREKENGHITEYFKSKGISYITETLNYGDYSYMLPAVPELGINRDMYFTSNIVIERKGSLEELSGNLAQQRERFEHEFLRAGDCDITLLIENSGGGFSDILTHKYKTKLSEKAFMASLMAWERRYGINIAFVSVPHVAQYIYAKCYYHLREFLK